MSNGIALTFLGSRKAFGRVREGKRRFTTIRQIVSTSFRNLQKPKDNRKQSKDGPKATHLENIRC